MIDFRRIVRSKGMPDRFLFQLGPFLLASFSRVCVCAVAWSVWCGPHLLHHFDQPGRGLVVTNKIRANDSGDGPGNSDGLAQREPQEN